MESRLEALREKINGIVIDHESENVCVILSHMYGVSKFCARLAKKS